MTYYHDPNASLAIDLAVSLMETASTLIRADAGGASGKDPEATCLSARPLRPRRGGRGRIRRRTGAYIRCATDRKEAVSRQRKACRAYASRLGAQGRVTTYLDIGASGMKIAGRAGLEALLSDVKAAKIDDLVVDDVDRLSRNFGDLMMIYETLRAYGVELHDVGRGKLDVAGLVIAGYLGQSHRP